MDVHAFIGFSFKEHAEVITFTVDVAVSYAFEHITVTFPKATNLHGG